ncbi:glycoside hydrolase family protein [Sphingomonas sp. NFR15]|uniref:glycoside hydrolase family protein n=1 Tax=Sphingomonas sp. NFR15 TaxID=1566282 RepID=UPI00088691EB|nr:glycoside hydrolase family protein [Sphingomonas sp. NFR15]SDA21539.1 lysozyme [Sphingomonas sp. NFR15]
MSYDRKKLERELARDEGRKLRVYLDTVKKRSIGVGRNLDDVGIRASERLALSITLASVLAKGITDHQCDVLLDNDIAQAEQDLDAKLPWWRTLVDARQRVLLNMCFNMGIGTPPSGGKPGKGLRGFASTLEAIRTGRYADAVAGMKASKWHGQVGARAVRLEAMMSTGKDAA